MSTSETLYTPDWPRPQVLVRGRTQTVQASLSRSGAAAAVTSGTYTLTRPDHSALISAGVVTVSGGVASYSVTAALLDSTEPMGPGWLESWELLMPDGVSHTYIRDCSVGQYQLALMVSDSDLTDGRYPDLATELGTTLTDFQAFRESAFNELIRKLHADGTLAHRIITTSSTYDFIWNASLRNIFAYLFRLSDGERHRMLYEEHRSATTAAYLNLSAKLDNDDDGFADEDQVKQLGGVVHLNVVSRRRARRSYKW